MDLDVLKDTVDQSVTLWNEGKHQEALKLLDEWIATAKKENRDIWVKVLSTHASVLANSKGDLGLVEHYCAQLLTYDPENALALYRLADVLFQQGKTEAAKQYAAKSYECVVHSKSEEDRSLLELLTKQWPEIDQWRV